MLLPTKVRDDIDGDGPRVANGKRKQRQHTGSHQGESALRFLEEQHSAEYMEPVCRKWKHCVNEAVLQFVVIPLTAPPNKKGPRVNQAGDTHEANAKRGREPSVVREGQDRSKE